MKLFGVKGSAHWLAYKAELEKKRAAERAADREKAREEQAALGVTIPDFPDQQGLRGLRIRRP